MFLFEKLCLANSKVMGEEIDIQMKLKGINKRSLVVKVTQWILLLARLGLVAAMIGMTVLLFASDESFTNVTVSLDAKHFAEADIALDHNLKQLPDGQSKLPDWITSSRLYVDSVFMDIQYTRGLRLLSFFLVLLVLSIYLFVVQQLLQLVRSVNMGSPFTDKNVFRIRSIGYLFIAFELIMFLFGRIARAIFKDNFQVQDASGKISVNLGTELLDNWVVIGLMILIIAEVFNKGVEMRKEQDLTI